jgi:hypothetical protein
VRSDRSSRFCVNKNYSEIKDGKPDKTTKIKKEISETQKQWEEYPLEATWLGKNPMKSII